MVEQQIGYRKSSLVLSARFPVVKWRSRSVAKSAYFRVRALSISRTRPSRSLERARPLTKAVFMFRAEKRNEHASTLLPRSPDRVWKNGGISNILLPKNKMFPLITWKEQAICLQKLQAVVITLSLLNFLEEYLIVKRTLTTSISLRCTGNVYALVRFFSDAFTKCVHIRKFLDI